MKYNIYNINSIVPYLKRGFRVLCALALMPCMSGCGISGNYREVDALQIIQTMGVDMDGGQIRLTVSSGQGLEDQPSVTISRTGASISAAIERAQDYSSKEDLYFAHTRFFVLGEDAARERLPEFLDYIARSAKLKMTSAVFVVRDGEAITLLTEDGKGGYNASEGLATAENLIKRTGAAYPFTGMDVICSLASYGSALVPAISLVPLEGAVFVEDGGETTSVPDGYGIVKDGYLAGYLDPEPARAATMLLGNGGQDYIPLDVAGGSVTLSTEESKASFSAKWGKDGRPEEITVKLDISCGLMEISDDVDCDSEDDLLSEAAGAMEEKLIGDIGEVLLASKELESDFLGIKGFLRSRHPGEIAEIGEDFPKLLGGADFKVEVGCKVERSYDFEQAQPLIRGGKVV